VQTAYAAAGVRLPRTARPQWRTTTAVPTSHLLAGDLLFFATDRSNWDSIHHVGIYLGGGRMLHAPTTGDVVRIAPVWWEEYFGATRVVPAVAGAPVPPPVGMPPVKPPKKPRPTPKPTPPAASPTPTPTPTPTGPASPTPTPTPTGPTPTPSTQLSPLHTVPLVPGPGFRTITQRRD
jgi:hypothetical protein